MKHYILFLLVVIILCTSINVPENYLLQENYNDYDNNNIVMFYTHILDKSTIKHINKSNILGV